MFQNATVSDEEDQLLLEIAEFAVSNVVPELIADVEVIASHRGVAPNDETEVNAVLEAFKLLTPIARGASLSAILTAGWRASFTDLWKEYPQLNHSRALNELILKSAQVLEYNLRLEAV